MMTVCRWRKIIELLGSMRFAIALLSLIAIASVAGTILRQNEPLVNYINQFGFLWATVFQHLDLYNVYSSWWFLCGLGFLVFSTTLCLLRNIPKIAHDLRDWKERVQEGNLRALHHHVTLRSPLARAQLTALLLKGIDGYRFRLKESAYSYLILGRKGKFNKLGYLFAHSAIVIICLGGLLDSDLLTRAQIWFGNKKPLTSQEQGNLIAHIPMESRLSENNLSFRTHLLIPEGEHANAALFNINEHLWVQELPFSLQLKQFFVDYYSTGMPRSFVSEVIITDPQTGQKIPATIKVNQPFTYRGITIYQSSFEDGGSSLQIALYPMQGASAVSIPLNGVVGNSYPLPRLLANNQEGAYTIELTGLRAINVEKISNDAATNVDGNQTTLARGEQWRSYFGSAAKSKNSSEFHNIGPSIQYKLRDASGQAYEFDNYMLPVLLEGAKVFLIGMRTTPNEPFRYLRIPADAQESIVGWMAFRAMLQNKKIRARAAQRYAERILGDQDSQPKDNEVQVQLSKTSLVAEGPDKAVLRAQLEVSAKHILDVFSGSEGESDALVKKLPSGGYSAVARMIENSVPLTDQARTAEVVIQILHGSLLELWRLTRADQGLNNDSKPSQRAVDSDENTAVTTLVEEQMFIQTAANALSDSFFYQAPVLLQLTDFKEVKASVFQLSRTPGKSIVYFGCVLLLLGIFVMFYIRERRLWIVLKEDGTGSQILMAYLAPHRTLMTEQEFASLCERVAVLGQTQFVDV